MSYQKANKNKAKQTNKQKTSVGITTETSSITTMPSPPDNCASYIVSCKVTTRRHLCVSITVPSSQ